MDRIVFPGRAWKSWLLVPIPFVYALRPLFVRQDLTSKPYGELIARMHDVVSRHSNRVLAYAAGHEHSLQVLRHAPRQSASSSHHGSRFTSYVLVSGSAAKLTRVGAGDDTLFKHAARGYMRLDVLQRGNQWGYWLEVVEIEAQNDGVVDRRLLRTVTRGPNT